MIDSDLSVAIGKLEKANDNVQKEFAEMVEDLDDAYSAALDIKSIADQMEPLIDNLMSRAEWESEPEVELENHFLDLKDAIGDLVEMLDA